MPGLPSWDVWNWAEHQQRWMQSTPCQSRLERTAVAGGARGLEFSGLALAGWLEHLDHIPTHAVEVDGECEKMGCAASVTWREF